MHLRFICLIVSFLATGGFLNAQENLCSVTSPVEVMDSKHKYKAAVLLVHGLNNSQKAMQSYKDMLEKANYYVHSVVLSGHEDQWKDLRRSTATAWVKDIEEAYCYLSRRTNDQKIIGFGFSLGALSLARFKQLYPDTKFAKFIFVAPAFELREHLYVAKAFLWLRYFYLWLPSFTPRDYRQRAFTSVWSYYALFDMLASFNKAWEASTKLHAIPTLVVLREGDELVHVPKLMDWKNTFKLKKWYFFIVPSFLEKGVHQHLLLDIKSMGKNTWNILERKILGFLDETMISASSKLPR